MVSHLANFDRGKLENKKLSEIDMGTPEKAIR